MGKDGRDEAKTASSGPCALFEKLWAFLKSVYNNITVEPCVLIFCIGTGFSLLVANELYIDKVCKVNLALGDEICENIQEHKEEQAAR